ncbi:hypothetical protein DRN85_08560 [Methanosarcinales archaeon]|nr:MAG: hypothetical protein DRN85_08560 [Methanosarcinales archaeon]
MSRQYGKELRLFILNREGKELFEWADKLSPTLAEKVKSAVACALSGCSKGTFLWNVFYYYGCDAEKVREELRQEYKEKGTIEMGKRWGFNYHTIQEGLKKLGIEIKPRIYNNAPYGLASDAFKKYGGIKAVLKRYSMTQFSKICKISHTTLSQYLRKQGYYYDRKERKWRVKGEK